jgi:gas vesicle protein
MGQDPSVIRAEIEETRARVGDEVDALSYKTDVSARLGDYVDDKKQAVVDKVAGARDAITGTASHAVPDGRQVGRLKDSAERNPLGLVIGGVAVGFVAGLLLPSTRIEDRQMGEMSDRVVDAAKETAGDALESGKQVAREAAESAKEQGGDLASNLQDRTQDAISGTQDFPTGGQGTSGGFR